MEIKPDWPKSFSRKGAAQHALTRYTVGLSRPPTHPPTHLPL